MVQDTFFVGLVCISGAIGYLSSTAHGFLVFGCGLVLNALVLGMLRYLNGDHTKK